MNIVDYIGHQNVPFSTHVRRPQHPTVLCESAGRWALPVLLRRHAVLPYYRYTRPGRVMIHRQLSRNGGNTLHSLVM